MAAIQITLIFGDSQANDESFHLLIGYQYLKTGSLQLSCEHPPLAEAVAAAPLLALNLRLPAAHRESGNSAEITREHEFLYANRYPVGTILAYARSAVLVWPLMLGGLVAWWTRRHFGPVAALMALLLVCYDPSFLAHGHYTDNDVPLVVCFMASVLSWDMFLVAGELHAAAICGVLTGLAMSTKYSALLLFPIYIVLYLLSWWRKSGSDQPARYKPTPSHLIFSMAIVVCIMFIVVFCVFRFEVRPLIPTELMENPEPVSNKLVKHRELLGELAPVVLNHPERLQLLDKLLQETPVPAASFFRGLFLVTRHGSSGHPTYLLGRLSTGGWWYYFPVVIAVKTPSGILLVVLLAVLAGALRLSRCGWRAVMANLKHCRGEWYVLTVPSLFYLAVSMASHINIGIRHVLPIYPFVYIFTAGVLLSGSTVQDHTWWRTITLGLIVIGLVETVHAYPDYLGFFNLPSGGVQNGEEYVVDSNLDWGQDLKRIKTYLSKRNIVNPCIKYFGIGKPDDYGITRWQPVPNALPEARTLGCLVVMSNTQFAYDGTKQHSYQWLRSLTPVDYVGSSFRVFRISGNQE